MKVLARSYALIAIFGLTGCARPQIYYSVDEARGACTAVQFPEWQFPKYPTDYGRFLFRKNPKGSGPVMLVAGDGSPGIGTEVSANKYRLNLDDPGHISPISDAEWDQAAKLPLVDHIEVRDPAQPKFSNGTWNPEPDAQVVYRGRSYEKAGRYWFDGGYRNAILSPDTNWLLLQSYDGPRPTGKGFMEGGEPTEGAFYLDVFHTTDAQRTFRVKGRLDRVEATYLGENAWAFDRYLILQLDSYRRSLLICNPAKAR